MRHVVASAFASVVLLAPGLASATDVQACLNASEKGQRSRASGKLRDAREQFLVCGAEGCPALVRKDCAQWQTELAAALPTVVFGAKDKQGRDLFDVTVTMDGEVLLKKLDGKSITIDPGPHTFRFEAAGSPAVTERALVKEGERARVITVVMRENGDSSSGDSRADNRPVTGPERDSSSGHTVYPWIVVGVGAAALIGGIVWFATAPSLPTGCDSSTAKCVRFASDTDSSFRARQEDAGRSDGQPIEGAVTMGIGGALVVGGLVWYFLEPSGARTGVLRPTPWTTANAAGLSLGGAF